jgi:hypothetical protein
MELKYKKSMEEHDLTYNELPDDAKIGIDNINDILKSKRMLEKVGKSLTPKALAKIKTYDKWVHYEILDFVHDTDNNDDEAPDLDDVEDEIEDKLNNSEEEEEEEEMEDEAPTQQGLQIEQELQQMFENGHLSCTIEEVRTHAPKTYNVLFDTYQEGEENGVVTSNFSLMENNKKFILTKK